MRPFGLLVWLVLLAACSATSSSEPGTPGEGTAVVGSPVPPAKIVRLDVPRLELQPGVYYAFPDPGECAVYDAAKFIESQPGWTGWKANDANNAVVTYVRDSTDGRVRLQQAVAKIGERCRSMRAAEPEVQRIAESAVSRRGLVQVITEPTEVSVLVGNDLRGITQVELWFAAGQHELRLDKKGYRAQRVPITVAAQMVTVVRATMQPQ